MKNPLLVSNLLVFTNCSCFTWSRLQGHVHVLTDVPEFGQTQVVLLCHIWSVVFIDTHCIPLRDLISSNALTADWTFGRSRIHGDITIKYNLSYLKSGCRIQRVIHLSSEKTFSWEGNETNMASLQSDSNRWMKPRHFINSYSWWCLKATYRETSVCYLFHIRKETWLKKHYWSSKNKMNKEWMIILSTTILSRLDSLKSESKLKSEQDQEISS